MILAQDLRDAVLQAAIQGKLTQQLPTDSSVDELLEKIRRQKELLIKEKKIKKEKPLKPISEDEIPFDIPDNWRWTKVGDTCINIQYGTSKKSELSGKVPVLRMGNIQNGKIDYTDLVYSSDEDDIEKYSLNKGDLLFNRTNSFELVGKVALYNGEYPAIYAGYLIRFTPIYILSEYLNLLMQSVYYKNYCWKVKSIGIQQSNINANKLCDFLYPLPPLEEQQRIVERVSELMAKIDEFEKIEKQLSAIKTAFPQDMRDALLQAAMQGKLTEQLPSDSSVDDLLEIIRKEKEQLINEKKIKKEKTLKPISEDEIPFDIPDSWRWTWLENIIYTISAKTYQIKQTEILKKGTYPVVSQSLNLIEGYSNEEEKLLKNPDIIIVFGDHSKTLKYIDFDFVVGADGTKLLVPVKVNPMYLYYVLKFNLVNLEDRNYGRHYGLLKAKPIPLPPIEEQQRIVQTLEKMLVACEGL